MTDLALLQSGCLCSERSCEAVPANPSRRLRVMLGSCSLLAGIYSMDLTLFHAAEDEQCLTSSYCAVSPLSHHNNASDTVLTMIICHGDTIILSEPDRMAQVLIESLTVGLRCSFRA